MIAKATERNQLLKVSGVSSKAEIRSLSFQEFYTASRLALSPTDESEAPISIQKLYSGLRRHTAIRSVPLSQLCQLSVTGTPPDLT